MVKRILTVILVISIVVISGLCFALYLRPSTIISKQEAKEKYSLPDSKFLTWRGGDVHYVDEGSGFPLLMIHGLAGSHRNFGKIAERLKDSYRCIRVDLPGFGLSDLPEVPQDNYRKLYSEFFNFFLDSLRLDSFYVMGNSMGGWMAWEIAAAHPEKVKRLVLLCSAGYDMEKIALKLSAGMKSSSAFVEKLTARGIPYFVTKNNVEKCFAQPSRANPEEIAVASGLTNREGNFHTVLELLRHRKDADTTIIHAISCPTLVVWGKEDNLIPYTHAFRFQRDVPRNKTIVYEDCGHIPMIEKVEELEKDFREFVRDTTI